MKTRCTWTLLVGLTLGLMACGGEDPSESPEGTTPAVAGAPELAPALELDAFTQTPSGLQYRDLTVGDGAEARSGQTVTVHYTGWLKDGAKFDSSLDRGEPFQFPLGQGQVIPGWEEGVEGMRVGGKRQLVIPPDLGYGFQGYPGVIPPSATLVFEVELLGIRGS